jgi:hypothetical protein
MHSSMERRGGEAECSTATARAASVSEMRIVAVLLRILPFRGELIVTKGVSKAITAPRCIHACPLEVQNTGERPAPPRDAPMQVNVRNVPVAPDWRRLSAFWTNSSLASRCRK